LHAPCFQHAPTSSRPITTRRKLLDALGLTTLPSNVNCGGAPCSTLQLWVTAQLKAHSSAAPAPADAKRACTRSSGGGGGLAGSDGFAPEAAVSSSKQSAAPEGPLCGAINQQHAQQPRGKQPQRVHIGGREQRAKAQVRPGWKPSSLYLFLV
jgi:hypothetical protein